MALPPDDWKMHPVSVYSLLNTNDVIPNMSERPDIFLNEMRKPSNVQGSTLDSSREHDTAKGGGH